MRTRLLLVLTAMLLALAFAGPAHAVMPDEVLADPALEARARSLSEGLRCMVCQNQSIDESDADLARDLRILVRERLQAGDSDRQVIDYLVSRYGEFVLLKPRLAWRTALLWGAPLLILVGGGVFVASAARKRPSTGAISLTDEEKTAIDALLRRD